MAFNYHESGDANGEFTTKHKHHHDAAAMDDVQQTINKFLEPIYEHFSQLQRCLTSEQAPKHFEKTLQYIEKSETSLKEWHRYGNNKFIPNLKSKTALLHYLEKKVDDLKLNLDKLVSEAMTNCCKDGLEMSRERLDFWRFKSFPGHSAYVQVKALNIYEEMYTWYFSTWLDVLDNTMQDSLEEFCKKVSAMQDRDATFLKKLEEKESVPESSISQDSFDQFYKRESVMKVKGTVFQNDLETIPEASISQASLDSESALSDDRDFEDCSTLSEDGDTDTWHNFKEETVSDESLACAESQAELDQARMKYQTAIFDLEKFQDKLKGASIRAMDQVFMGTYTIRKAVFRKALEPEFHELNQLLDDYRRRVEDISDGKVWQVKTELEHANSAEHAADMEKMNCISRVKLMIRLCLYYFYSYIIDHLEQYMTAANIIHRGLQKYELDDKMNSVVNSTMQKLENLHESWTKDLRQHMKHLCEGKMRRVQKLEQTEAYFRRKVQELNQLYQILQSRCEKSRHNPVSPYLDIFFP